MPNFYVLLAVLGVLKIWSDLADCYLVFFWEMGVSSFKFGAFTTICKATKPNLKNVCQTVYNMLNLFVT